MKVIKSILSFALLLCTLTGIAQTQSGVNSSQHSAASDIGILYGKVIDINTSKAIDGVTVQILQSKADSNLNYTKSKIIHTVLSDKKGDFSFENLSLKANYTLRFSATGYTTLDLPAGFDIKNIGSNSIANLSNKDVGNIRLTKDEKQLETVTVNGTKSLLQLNLDKKVYNVEKDISATGGTAVDVMKNVPSVNVDIDGNVTLRNAPPQIFIDGRPSTLTLDQIPADQIASVEIMTNPSAKYDASGGGSGILNIVLKKNRKVGYNGNVRANIDSRGKPGFGGDINIKQNKINFFASGNIAFRKSITKVFTSRIDSLYGGAAHYTQNNRPVNTNIFAFGRMGIDYLMDNRNTISVSGNIVNGDFKVRDLFDIYTDTITPYNYYKQTAVRTLAVKAGFKNYGTAIGYKHNFARSGRELTSDLNLNFSRNNNTSDYNNTLYDANNLLLPAPGAQRATGGGTSKNYTYQTDYVDPFSTTQKIEMGVRASFRTYKNWNDNYLQDPNTNIYELIPDIGVMYKYNDRVLAVYTSYSQQIKSFSYQAGLRIESSEYSGDFITKNQQFSNKYPFSLFPSAFLSYKLNDKQDVQLNYSRKINRPNFFQLIPFVDFSDSLNLSVGNPALKPEFTHLVELAWSNQYSPGNTVLVSLYSKLTNDLITRYQYIDSVINPARKGRYTTYANANNSFTAGLEITGKNKIATWWDLTSNINFFNVKIEANNLTGVGTQQQFSWFGKLNNNFKLPKNFSVQLSGEYQAKTILPASSGSSRGGSGGGGMGFGGPQTTAQGYLKPTYGVDIAIKKDFFKNNTGSLTLQFTDIFRTRIFATHAETIDFAQDNRRQRDPQLLRLNFNWRFGKFDATLFKRKNTKSDQDLQSMQGGQ